MQFETKENPLKQCKRHTKNNYRKVEKTSKTFDFVRVLTRIKVKRNDTRIKSKRNINMRVGEKKGLSTKVV
jgi:hypothetical protein